MQLKNKKKNFGLKSLILILIISNNCFADTCDLPVKVSTGDKAPCNGYVFSDNNEQKIRTDLAYKNALIDNLTKRNTIQEDMLKIDAQQIQIYNDKLNKESVLTVWEKVLYFGLGALVTSAAAYGTMKALK